MRYITYVFVLRCITSLFGCGGVYISQSHVAFGWLSRLAVKVHILRSIFFFGLAHNLRMYIHIVRT